MAMWAPPPVLRFGRHSWPAFSVFGSMGIVVGAVGGCWLGHAAGLRARALVLLAVAGVVTVLIDIVGQAAVRGYVNLIAMREAGVSVAAVTVGAVLIRQPIGPLLDVYGVGLMLTLAVGRLGCLAGGCCYGRPSSYGVRYQQAHVESGFPEHLVGMTLRPLQLIEMAVLLAMALGGAAAILSGGAATARPGVTFGGVALGYALLRAALEPSRGDRGFTSTPALTTPQWCAVGIAVLAIAFVGAGTLPGWQAGPALAVVALCGGQLAAHRAAGSQPTHTIPPDWRG
jgi:prolipoprotein diacylglyceryltransferase